MTKLLALLFFLITPFASAYAQCQSQIVTAEGSEPNNDTCIENWDACTYLMGVGAIFSPVNLTWYSDGTVCGGYPYGDLRIEGHNHAAGKMTIYVLLEASDSQRDTIFSGELTKRLTTRSIIWEGTASSPDGRSEPIYLKRSRFPPTDLSPIKIPTRTSEQTDLEFQYGAGHGAYYCGDGGCDAAGVFVVVNAGSEASFLTDLANSDIKHRDVTRVPETDSANICNIGPHNTRLDLGGNACFIVSPVPLFEPETTMALRQFDNVIYTRRFGGEATVDETSFMLEDGQLLINRNTVNTGALSALYNDTIAENSMSLQEFDSFLQISEPNALSWKIQSNRSVFDNIRLAHPNVEWWQFTLRLYVAQKNFGQYVLALEITDGKSGFAKAGELIADDALTGTISDEDMLHIHARLFAMISKNVPRHIFIP